MRDADDVIGLLRAAGTFQLVQGRVAAVADVRGVTYLNFGEDHRQDFTLVVKPQVKRAIAEAMGGLEGLTGKLVRARGFIERRGGPMIELTHAGALEVIAEAAEAAAPPRRRSRRRAQQ